MLRRHHPADVEELIAKANEHMHDKHDSYELEEMIEDAAVDVPDA